MGTVNGYFFVLSLYVFLEFFYLFSWGRNVLRFVILCISVNLSFLLWSLYPLFVLFVVVCGFIVFFLFTWGSNVLGVCLLLSLFSPAFMLYVLLCLCCCWLYVSQ